MPFEGVFLETAKEFDGLLIDGMNAAIISGLGWAKLQITAALSLYVITYAFMTTHGKVDSWTAVLAGGRAMAIGAILMAANYNYYVRDLFFTDLPNQIAAAINGPRVSVNSAQQFDVLWSAVLNYTSYILAQATGISQLDNHLIAWGLAMMNHGALWVCFGMWYMSRVFLAVIISMGPFLILLFLFRSTREYAQQWVGKLVGLTALGLGSAVVLRMILVALTSRLAGMQATPGMSVDQMIANASATTGVFFLSAILMITLPSIISIGAGMGAGHAVAGGLIGGTASMVTRKGIGAGIGGAKLMGKAGMALGKYTGSR